LQAISKGVRRFWVALILGALAAFPPLSLDMYLPALPQIELDLSTTTSLTQLTLTAFLIGLSVGQVWIGPLSDLRGRRYPLLAGLIVYTISSLLCAFSPSIGWLIVFRVVQGLAGAASVVISTAIVRDLYSGTQLTKFFALLSLISGVAPVLAPIIGAQLLHFSTWPGLFIVLAVLGAAIMASVILMLPETLPPERRSRGGVRQSVKDMRMIASDRVFMGHALSRGLVMAAYFAYISGSPFVVQNLYGGSPTLFSLIFAVNGAGIIVTSQLTGKLAGRISEMRMLTIGLSAAAVGGVGILAAVVLDAGLYAMLVPLFVVVSSIGTINTTTGSLAMESKGDTAGSASALLGLLTFIPGALIIPFVGLEGGLSAMPMALLMVITLMGALLSHFVLARPWKT
jgi:drug resistance transporter, Bcr/CflA subfamily